MRHLCDIQWWFRGGGGSVRSRCSGHMLVTVRAVPVVEFAVTQLGGVAWLRQRLGFADRDAQAGDHLIF